jgi:glyoxylase-like metal-dependent hydrolase (beta-lactamase superfamily II)
MSRPAVQAFFDEATNTVSYVVSDAATRRAAIVDPVLDYDPASGRTAHRGAARVLDFVADRRLSVEIIGAPVAIGAHITTVQETFGRIFNAGADFRRDGRQFDRLLKDGETFTVGDMPARALHTPGHTPACMVYVIGDAAFVGDTLFMPDYGTARCDFPGGDARTLYRSIQRIFALPADTRLFMCHDYKAPGRDAYAWESTVEAQRRDNVHVREGIDEDAFVRLREARDATLAVPHLLLPSVQVNMRAGSPPPPEDNGVSYLKIPIDAPWEGTD